MQNALHVKSSMAQNKI